MPKTKRAKTRQLVLRNLERQFQMVRPGVYKPRPYRSARILRKG